MKWSDLRYTLASLVGLGLGAGCSSQAGPDYAGEPLAAVSSRGRQS
jgi:hypothetical protein